MNTKIFYLLMKFMHFVDNTLYDLSCIVKDKKEHQQQKTQHSGEPVYTPES